MLDLLDIAVGFAVVMLGFSLIITSLTQAVVSLLGLRGTKLRTGLTALLTEAVPGIKDQARTLSDAVLRHPLVSDSSISTTMPLWGLASTIKREELIPVLTAVLKSKKVRALTADEAHAIEQWFDTFMSRVSQWFAMNTRIVTVVFALAIASYVQLDATNLWTNLSNDSASRARLAAMSAPLLEQAQKPGGDCPAGSTNCDPLTASTDRAKTINADLTTAAPWLGTDKRAPDWFAWVKLHLYGYLASVILLSLGAPFWYNTLKNLTSLRSVVAQQTGDTNTPDATARGGGAAAGAAAGVAAAVPPPIHRLPELP